MTDKTSDKPVKLKGRARAQDSAAHLRTRSGAQNPLLPANRPAAAPSQLASKEPDAKSQQNNG